MKNLRKNIKNLRCQKGWTQLRLAKELNVSEDAVSKWETERNMPSVEDVVRISKIFNISIDALLNSNFDMKSIVEIERIPANVLQHKNDSEHIVYAVPLKGGATLHRFSNGRGQEYSAIYVGFQEQKNNPRELEYAMMLYWNETFEDGKIL
jgi:transcriptional regulator with XRE-family HTH domain